MSSELSVSETTPLRRPDLHDEAPTSTPTRSVNANQSGTNGSVTRNVITTNLLNNNNIDADSRIHINCDNQPIAMETNKRILCRIGTDVFVIICVGLPILLFFILGTPYKRGFFCDDESLMHPFHDSTIRNWMLYLMGLVLPTILIATVEVIKANEKSGNVNCRRYTFYGWEVPEWLLECYKTLGVYLFGAAASQLTTDVAKYSIGRLRPHFFSVCQPVMPDGSTCADPINAARYIEEFTCLGINSTPQMLKEVRLSFPSGHSSFSTYAMLYMALYLQARMNWKGSKLLRHLLQFLLILIAWYTALSRVSDYKHHWSDVLSGILIGTVIALLVANCVSDLFRKPIEKMYLPTTRTDLNTPPQTITITNGHS